MAKYSKVCVRSDAESWRHEHTQAPSGMKATPQSQHTFDGDLQRLGIDIGRWALELGFDRVGITDTRLDEHEAHLLN